MGSGRLQRLLCCALYARSMVKSSLTRHWVCGFSIQMMHRLLAHLHPGEAARWHWQHLLNGSPNGLLSIPSIGRPAACTVLLRLWRGASKTQRKENGRPTQVCSEPGCSVLQTTRFPIETRSLCPVMRRETSLLYQRQDREAKSCVNKSPSPLSSHQLISGLPRGLSSTWAALCVPSMCTGCVAQSQSKPASDNSPGACCLLQGLFYCSCIKLFHNGLAWHFLPAVNQLGVAMWAPADSRVPGKAYAHTPGWQKEGASWMLGCTRGLFSAAAEPRSCRRHTSSSSGAAAPPGPGSRDSWGLFRDWDH